MTHNDSKQEIAGSNLEALFEKNIDSIAKKADVYKKWSRRCTVSLAASSALIPVFVGVFDMWVLDKLIPSCLAALSVVIAAYIQLEKPQERWRLYRRAQRRLEREWLRYTNRLDGYSSATRDQDVIVAIQQILDDLHNEWEGLIPDSKESVKLASGRHSQ